MTTVNSALSESILRYGSARWQSWLSDTNHKKLEVEQKTAIRIITGTPRATNEEALWHETNVRPARFIGKEMAMTAYKASSRLQEGNHRKITSQRDVHRSLAKNRGRRQQARAAVQQIVGGNPKEPFRHHKVPLWQLLHVQVGLRI